MHSTVLKSFVWYLRRESHPCQVHPNKGTISLSSQISLYMAFSIAASLLAFCGIVSACVQLGFLATTKNHLKNTLSYTNPCSPDYGTEIVEDASMECEAKSSDRYYPRDAECVTRQEIDSCVEEVSGLNLYIYNHQMNGKTHLKRENVVAQI